LDVAQRRPGVERVGYEGVAQAVRGDALVDPRRARQASDDLGGVVAVDAPAASGGEQGSVLAPRACLVDGLGAGGGEGELAPRPLRVTQTVRWPRRSR
jgi:hypothetical protein